MFCQLLLALWGVASAFAQAPNTVAQRYPTLRTASSNQTTFIIPVAKDLVADAVKPHRLLPVPTGDTILFPNGFPADKHPVTVVIGLQFDIRMGPLFIQALGVGSILAPFVDVTKDGKSPVQVPVKQFIAGYDGNALGGVVPAIASTLFFGYTLETGTSTPDDAAYERLDDDDFSAQMRRFVAPNPGSGPGVEPAAIDLLFHDAATSTFTSETFRSVLNQPTLQNTGKCQRNALWFNESFANPTFRTGTVRLYGGLVGEGPFPGAYENQAGWSAVGENVGFSPQSCQDAVKQTT